MSLAGSRNAAGVLLPRFSQAGSVLHAVLQPTVRVLLIGIPSRDPFLVTQHLERHVEQATLCWVLRVPSGERASVKSEARTCRSSIGTQECDHVGRVAEQETCGAGEPHSTSSFGFRARVNAPIGQAAVREVPPDSAFCVYARTRRMHKRDALCLPRRPREQLLTSPGQLFQTRRGSHSCWPR